MTEYEHEVLTRLTAIEANSDHYITWKTVAGGIAAGFLLIIGYGENLKGRIDDSVGVKIAVMQEEFEHILASNLSEFQVNLAADLGSGNRFPQQPILASGVMPVYDKAGAITGFGYAKDQAEWAAIVESALMRATEKGAIDIVVPEDLFVKDNGDFVPWMSIPK